jgi:site-specific recombinase XerD
MIRLFIATNIRRKKCCLFKQKFYEKNTAEAERSSEVSRKEKRVSDLLPAFSFSENADPLVKRFADYLVTVVGNTTPSPHTRRAYERAARDFLDWWIDQGCPELSRALVQAYVATLRQEKRTPSTINQRLAAIRKLAREAAENGWLDEQRARGIEGVKGEPQRGKRTGKWLTKHQAQALLDAPDVTQLKGLRDRAVLAVLVGCGLRREELTRLTFKHIQQRDGAWAIIDLVGKRDKVGSIPMAGWVKVALDEWAEAAHLSEGACFRAVNKSGVVSAAPLSPQAIYKIVVSYRGLLPLEGEAKKIAPHDLRRTHAKLAHKGHVPLEQIQMSLRHEKIDTTIDYINPDQDFSDPPGERLGLVIRRRQRS